MAQVKKYQLVLSESRYRKTLILTLIAATLEPFASLSRLQRSTKTLRPGLLRLLQKRFYRCPFILWFSISLWRSGCFPLSLPLRPGSLLKLGEPTEPMRLPQLNTCHPPRHRLGKGEGEGSCLALFQ